jgi:hypothetical protein
MERPDLPQTTKTPERSIKLQLDLPLNDSRVPIPGADNRPQDICAFFNESTIRPGITCAKVEEITIRLATAESAVARRLFGTTINLLPGVFGEYDEITVQTSFVSAYFAR